MVSFRSNKIPYGDFFGGVTAVAVSLPLALAFGVTSGLGAMSGMYGAIAVGLIASLFGGIRSQISGPTAPMMVVMSAVFLDLVSVAPLNAISLCFTVVILAGFFQLLAGFFKFGKYLALVPPIVVTGFMSGVGIIVILLQISPLGGLSIKLDPVEALFSLDYLLRNYMAPAVILGLVTLVMQFFWSEKASHWVPAPLAGLVIGSLISIFPWFDSIPRIGNIPETLPSLHLPVFDWVFFPHVISGAFLLALVGAIDTLFTGQRSDKLIKIQNKTEQELIGQGLGNIASGLIGGLPGAGTNKKTLDNIKADGKSKRSGVVHSLILTGLIFGIVPLASEVPLTVLAGILIKVGVDIISWRTLTRLSSMPSIYSFLLVIVIFLTVAVGPLTAITVGVVVSSLAVIERLASDQLSAIRCGTRVEAKLGLTAEASALLDAASDKVFFYKFGNTLNYGISQATILHFQSKLIHRVTVVILDLTATRYIDVAMEETLSDLVNLAKNFSIEGKSVIIEREVFLVIENNTIDKLKLFNTLSDFPSEKIFNRNSDALRRALSKTMS